MKFKDSRQILDYRTIIVLNFKTPNIWKIKIHFICHIHIVCTYTIVPVILLLQSVSYFPCSCSICNFFYLSIAIKIVYRDGSQQRNKAITTTHGLKKGTEQHKHNNSTSNSSVKPIFLYLSWNAIHLRNQSLTSGQDACDMGSCQLILGNGRMSDTTKIRKCSATKRE